MISYPFSAGFSCTFLSALGNPRFSLVLQSTDSVSAQHPRILILPRPVSLPLSFVHWSRILLAVFKKSLDTKKITSHSVVFLKSIEISKIQ
jgi:hypothetical protein